jgi:hypothetical protein
MEFLLFAFRHESCKFSMVETPDKPEARIGLVFETAAIQGISLPPSR